METHQPQPDVRHGSRLAFAVTATLLAFAIALMVFLCYVRGVWIDELWSIWMSRRDLPLQDLMSQRWVRDVHPPLFAALSWLFEPLVGSDIAARRMLNLLPLGGLLLTSLYLARRRPENLPIILIFLCLLATNRYFLVYFAEHRPYFLLECAYGAALLSLFEIHRSNTDYDHPRDFPLALLLTGSIFVTLSAQYISAFVAAIPLSIIILELIIRKQWRWAVWSTGAALFAIAPLLTSFYLQLRYLTPTIDNLWIRTDFTLGLQTIGRVIGYSGASNVVGAAASAIAIFTALRGGAEEQRARLVISRGFVSALTMGVLLSALAMIVINELKPIIQPRYLTPFAPAVSLVLAILAAPTLVSRTAMLVAFVLNAFLLAAFWSYRETDTLRWYDTARYIRTEVQACPSARVYGLDPKYITPYLGAQGHDDVQAWGYGLVGRQFGFDVTQIKKGSGAQVVVGDRCPTLIWAEHVPWSSAEQVRAADFTRSLPEGRSLASASLYKGKSGFVLKLEPVQ